MDTFARISLWLTSHWRSNAVITGIGIAAGLAVACQRRFAREGTRAQRAERKREKELSTLADKIAIYARNVHKCYPTGDVVVSQGDLAMQLRKSPDKIATALDIMLGKQLVTRAALNGYWKLDVNPRSTL